MAAIDNVFEKMNPTNDANLNPMNAPERFFDSMGLMRGEYAPVGRAVVGGVIGAGIMFAIRPSFAFNSDGSPKPWGSGSGKTQLPWWILPFGLAVFSGVFV